MTSLFDSSAGVRSPHKETDLVDIGRNEAPAKFLDDALWSHRMYGAPPFYAGRESVSIRYDLSLVTVRVSY